MSIEHDEKVAARLAEIEQREQVQGGGVQEPIEEGPGFQFPGWLTAKTGEGPISSYREHPMNFLGSDSLGRIIRGLTGLVGEFDLALIDIAWGLIEMTWKKPQAQAGGDSA